MARKVRRRAPGSVRHAGIGWYLLGLGCLGLIIVVVLFGIALKRGADRAADRARAREARWQQQEIRRAHWAREIQAYYNGRGGTVHEVRAEPDGAVLSVSAYDSEQTYRMAREIAASHLRTFPGRKGLLIVNIYDESTHYRVGHYSRLR